MSAAGCLEYQGYIGSVEMDREARCFHGKIEFIQDLVTFEGASFKELEREFRAAVKDYLATCKKVGREPDVPFSGTFNVRVGPELHKRLAIAARKSGRSLNELVKDAIEKSVTGDRMSAVASRIPHLPASLSAVGR